MVQQKTKGGTAMVLTGASLWGLIGLFNRTLMAAGLTPESIVLVRNLGGLVLLGLVLLQLSAGMSSGGGGDFALHLACFRGFALLAVVAGQADG